MLSQKTSLSSSKFFLLFAWVYSWPSINYMSSQGERGGGQNCQFYFVKGQLRGGEEVKNRQLWEDIVYGRPLTTTEITFYNATLERSSSNFLSRHKLGQQAWVLMHRLMGPIKMQIRLLARRWTVGKDQYCWRVLIAYMREFNIWILATSFKPMYKYSYPDYVRSHRKLEMLGFQVHFITSKISWIFCIFYSVIQNCIEKQLLLMTAIFEARLIVTKLWPNF